MGRTACPYERGTQKVATRASERGSCVGNGPKESACSELSGRPDMRAHRPRRDQSSDEALDCVTCPRRFDRSAPAYMPDTTSNDIPETPERPHRTQARLSPTTRSGAKVSDGSGGEMAGRSGQSQTRVQQSGLDLQNALWSGQPAWQALLLVGGDHRGLRCTTKLRLSCKQRRRCRPTIRR
jgi:hypothetical protein